MLTKLTKADSFEERKPILDNFFTTIESKTKEV